MLILIIVGNVLRQPEKTSQNQIPAKQVEVYTIGSVPKIKLQGNVEKSGTLALISSASGYSYKIFRNVGSTVNKGERLFWISNTVTGGTIPSLSREIAEKNDTFIAENYDRQKDLIQKRKVLTENIHAQNEDLRKISEESISATNGLIQINETMLNTIDLQINELEINNTDGSNDSLILQAQQGKAAVMSALSALRNGLRNTQYQVGNDNEPVKINTLTKDITLTQISIEEKSLELNKELSKLNVKIARISESLMFPQSPCNGIIERIHVVVGQNITPGTLLANISCYESTVRIIVPVSGEISRNIARIDTSTITVGTKSIEILPVYISQEPTEGSLHSIQYILPKEFAATITDGNSIVVEVPIGEQKTTSSVPFIPIDSLYQTQTGTYIYVVSNNEDSVIATAKKVKVGTVYGSYVEVIEGLNDSDKVIINRNVIEGDRIEINTF